MLNNEITNITLHEKLHLNVGLKSVALHGSLQISSKSEILNKTCYHTNQFDALLDIFWNKSIIYLSLTTTLLVDI